MTNNHKILLCGCGSHEKLEAVALELQKITGQVILVDDICNAINQPQPINKKLIEALNNMENLKYEDTEIFKDKERNAKRDFLNAKHKVRRRRQL